MLIFIVDIDGTVADTQARVDEITEKYKLDSQNHWTDEHIDEFTRSVEIKKDGLIPGSEILPELARRCKAKLIFLTGRSSRARAATRIWLKNQLDIFDSVPLIMRQDGDLSGPVEAKLNAFKEAVLRIHPDANFIFFDDDERLLLEYSKYGLALRAPKCWGNIAFLNE